MRVMQDLIDAEELGEQLERDLAEAGIGTQFCLGDIPEMDEDSDEPDPEQGLRDEAKDQSNMVEAATAIAEAQQLRLDFGARPHESGRLARTFVDRESKKHSKET